ncbi:DUF302 domain-containing protein [Escherichia coli]|nr:DUF302 domain-containing protein [Escherichia coli]HCP5918618.1 DUF302 domain-containing protein [Escherichia coli]
MSFFLKPVLLSLTLIIASTSIVLTSESKTMMIVKSPSEFDYTTTRERLIKSVYGNGLILFGEFDHAQAAQNVGLSMPPTTVLVFGNPKGGTSLMLANPDLALDLPFRVLISQQSDGRVMVSYHSAEALQGFGLSSGSIEALIKLEQLVENSIARP